jgi:signal transduction histidine kinase
MVVADCFRDQWLTRVVEISRGRVRITAEGTGQGTQLLERPGDLATIGKLGPVGMHERAQLLGGTLTVRSGLGERRTIVVDVPAPS